MGKEDVVLTAAFYGVPLYVACVAFTALVLAVADAVAGY
jgi:hypothetical protein